MGFPRHNIVCHSVHRGTLLNSQGASRGSASDRTDTQSGNHYLVADPAEAEGEAWPVFGEVGAVAAGAA
jgi:hypothetical protein